MSCLVNVVYYVLIIYRQKGKISLFAHQSQTNLFWLLELRGIFHFFVKPYLIREIRLIKHSLFHFFLLTLRLLLRIQNHIKKRVLHWFLYFGNHSQLLLIHGSQHIIDRSNVVPHFPQAHIGQKTYLLILTIVIQFLPE